MDKPSNNRSIGLFYLLVLFLTLPFYYLIAQKGVTVAWMLALVPLPAALIFVFREEKGGVGKLLKRYSIKIPKVIWYIPTILLMPVIWFLADRVLSLFTDIPTPVLLVEQWPFLFILLLVAGSTEEIAWMGYVFDPLEERWKTFNATLILGIIWVIWHVPAYYILGQSITQIVVFSIFMIGWRFLIVWIYKNTGKSLFTPSLFHAMGNLTMAGVQLSIFNVEVVGFLGLVILGVITIITAFVVILLWGSELDKYGYSRTSK